MKVGYFLQILALRENLRSRLEGNFQVSAK